MPEKKKLKISGMHCASCALIIEKSLKKVDGVKSATVNFGTEKATIEFDPEKVDAKKLIKTIEKTGYKAYDEKLDDEDKKIEEKEIKKLKVILIFSIMMTIPIFILSMFIKQFPNREYILFALTTPVQFIAGYRFYKGIWKGLKNKTVDMDSLIALGTSSAYLYSLYSLYTGMGHLYFETSAMLITFILLGKYLEVKTKGRTRESIKKLLRLSPKMARVIRNGKEIEIPIDDVKT